MKRTSLAAMLTLLATIAATLAVAGCGGKSTSGSTSTPTTSSPTTTTTTTHNKHTTNPHY